jgi:hypothetical protein
MHQANKLPAKRAPTARKVMTGTLITSHAALLADMDVYRREVTATPEMAKAFLMRLGVLTPRGKTKQLIRG